MINATLLAVAENAYDRFLQMDTAAIKALTDEYFNKVSLTVEMLDEDADEVVYAVFVRAPTIAALKFVRRFIELNYGENKEYPLEIKECYEEGTLVPAGKPLMYIRGDHKILSPMETLFLQLVGWTCIAARNAYTMAMAQKDIPFMDMHGRHAVGTTMNLLSTYAAAVGTKLARMQGAVGFVGTSQGEFAPLLGEKSGRGTMPHALIGRFKVDLIKKALGKNKVKGKKKAALNDFFRGVEREYPEFTKEQLKNLTAIRTGTDPKWNATLEATKAYYEMLKVKYPEDRAIVVLIDFEGREITDALAVSNWFYNEAKLDKEGFTLGFRLDTHGGRFIEGIENANNGDPWKGSVETLMKWTHASSPDEVMESATAGIGIADLGGKSVDDIKDKYLFGTGVTAANVVWLRKNLDDEGFKNTFIVASSGFDVLKCKIFANLKIPVNVIGTGSFLPKKFGETYATADIVEYDGFPAVKVGREYLLLS